MPLNNGMRPRFGALVLLIFKVFSDNLYDPRWTRIIPVEIKGDTQKWRSQRLMIVKFTEFSIKNNGEELISYLGLIYYIFLLIFDP
uniref:Neur_chan_LBD domain-containing protein n=1 Tax=Steinernema glaseri TaxID=37863 RepID=A0A1I7YVF6_9BILA